MLNLHVNKNEISGPIVTIEFNRDTDRWDYKLYMIGTGKQLTITNYCYSWQGVKAATQDGYVWKSGSVAVGRLVFA